MVMEEEKVVEKDGGRTIHYCSSVSLMHLHWMIYFPNRKKDKKKGLLLRFWHFLKIE